MITKNLLAFLVFLLLIPVNALGQAITLTSPLQDISVSEADDFASNELQNPWDFSERRDIGWEESYKESSINVQGGVWTGVNDESGGYIFPLFGGFIGGLFPESLPGDTNLPQLGINTPIDTSRYTLLSYRMKHSERTAFAVYWHSDPSESYWPGPEGPRGASYDGFYHWNTPHQNTGFTIYSFDLTNLSTAFEQHQESWSGDVIALRLDPSIGCGPEQTTELDWIRLVDPDSAPEMTITWNSDGLNPFTLVSLYVDTDNSGYDGDPLARFTDGNDPETYTFNSGLLPPGEYYFYLEAIDYDSNGDPTPLRSAYSAKLTINAAPTAYFTSPTQQSGPDYATSELGDPWDMNEWTDVANLDESVWPDDWRQFSDPSFVDGVFQASANPPLPQNNESDVQVHMNIPTSTPIDTSKYRYLVYRMAVDPTNYGDLSDRVARGWVSRPVFWNTHIIDDAGRPSAHIVYEGWNTYVIDLWDDSIIEAGIPWTSFDRIVNFRLDPLETDVSTWFYLDWVELRGENHADDNTFDLSWVIEDNDSDVFSVSLYYDDNNDGLDGTLIITLDELSAGEHSYVWNAEGLAEGQQYYVYLTVNDGVNTTRVYAPVPIVMGAFSGRPVDTTPKPRFDYDGDGASDHVIYRPSEGGVWYVRASNQGVPTAVVEAFGDIFWTPINGDFDGDDKTDYATVVPIDGFLHWFINLSSTGNLYYRMWGLETDRIVVADYNGDGTDDIAVYRNGAWFIIYADGSVGVYYWGIPGDEPVPADYDGDGKTDVAIWRPSTGNWWILYSGFTTGHADDYYAVIQWGLSGDKPMPGDFDNDGRADTCVWRPGDGTWYLKTIADQEISFTQWGLPGDTPIVGDYNGDGRLDFTVFRPDTAMWYHNFRNNETSAVQWGLSDDLLPIND